MSFTVDTNWFRDRSKKLTSNLPRKSCLLGQHYEYLDCLPLKVAQTICVAQHLPFDKSAYARPLRSLLILLTHCARVSAENFVGLIYILILAFVMSRTNLLIYKTHGQP